MQLDYLALALLGLLTSVCLMAFAAPVWNLGDPWKAFIGLPGLVLALFASVKLQRRYWL